MQKVLVMIAFYLLGSNILYAQLEGVRIETYYISDANDATDTFGGSLEEGTTTYRIFINMAPESKLLKIYGDQNHPLIIESTEFFFNHLEEGVTFGKDLNRNRFGDGTVALDTWLTIGQVSKSFSQGAYLGVVKEKDDDGSIVGGINNDGGSEEIPGGLLRNDDPTAGIPLTTADGLAISTTFPTDWLDVDFLSPLTGEDNTIFGTNDVKEFESRSAFLQNSGTSNPFGTDNEVIIAQLTTKGELSFTLNLEIEFKEDGQNRIVHYVGTDSILLADEVFDPLLSFPYTCGCKDPDFLEARSDFACEDNSQCLTPVVFGCLDTIACNYNMDANFHIEDLCCYIGYCDDRDISLVCPELPMLRSQIISDHLKLYPNPANTNVNISFDMDNIKKDIPYTIIDILGRKRKSGVIIGKDHNIDITDLESGTFYIQFLLDEEIVVIKSISVY